MDIKPSDIAEFKALYKQIFGIVLTDNVALIKLSMLVRQMELTYVPFNASQYTAADYVNGNGNGNNNGQLPKGS